MRKLYRQKARFLCSKRKTINQFKKEVFELVGDEYAVVGEYRSNHTKIKLKHNMCGNIFEMTPGAFLRGQRCPNERYLRSSQSYANRYSKENELKQICTTEGYTIISGYTRSKNKIELLHDKCGKIFYPVAYDFIVKGTRCPHCYRSIGEEIIGEILKENNIEFEEQYRFDDCKNKRKLPFDFAIFKNNELQSLIEYDGMHHFYKKFDMTDDDLKAIQLNDEIKNEYCKNKNIPLLRIRYIQKYDKNEVKAKLTEILKSNKII